MTWDIIIVNFEKKKRKKERQTREKYVVRIGSELKGAVMITDIVVDNNCSARNCPALDKSKRHRGLSAKMGNASF